jgi:hypothetical protein
MKPQKIPFRNIPKKTQKAEAWSERPGPGKPRSQKPRYLIGKKTIAHTTLIGQGVTALMFMLPGDAISPTETNSKN